MATKRQRWRNALTVLLVLVLGPVLLAGCQVFLERLLKDAGSPTDPVEVMMLEQLAFAHFRIADLHVGAGLASGIEAIRVYNAVAARLLGEFRRTALALRAYRSRIPEGAAEQKLKLVKLAQ